MRKLFLALCMLGILISPIYAAAPPDIAKLFSEGNSYYSRGKFNDAVKAYEEAISRGYESGPLYYNLGNAYFKSNALGKAILNYRRSERLEPLDADLKSNLEYVASLVKQGSGGAEINVLTRLFLTLSRFFSIDSISVMYLVFFALLFLWAVSFIFINPSTCLVRLRSPQVACGSTGSPPLELSRVISRGSGLTLSFDVAQDASKNAELVEASVVERVKNIRKGLGYISIPVIVFFIMAAAILGGKYYDTVMHKEAVIIAQNTNCKFEPFDDATTYFTLYEGEDVIVISEKGIWAKIRRSDNKQGWIKKEAMELL